MEDSVPFSNIVNDVIKNIENIQFDQSVGADYNEQFDKVYQNISVKVNIDQEISNLVNSFNDSKRKKNIDQSVALREAGNKLFNDKQLQKALECYSQSIILANCPETFEHQNEDFVEFAMSLVNRCLLKQNLPNNILLLFTLF